MRGALLLLIRAYWRLPLIPRGRCLFVETCSRYVYRRTEEDGLVAGMRAAYERWRQCRPGYRAAIMPTGDLAVQLADGSMVPTSAMRMKIDISVGGIPAEYANERGDTPL